MALPSITTDQIVTTAREVVAERPEFVYTPPKNPDPDDENGDFCQYVHTDAEGKDSCGCIMSHVLNRLGVPLDYMKQREGQPASMVIDSYFTAGVSAGVTEFADELQYRQDSGKPWGEALAIAERYAPAKVIL